MPDLTVNRRTFVKGTAAGIGLAMLSAHAAPAQQSPKRFVLVGTGSRSHFWQDALLKEHRENGRIVGVCDTNAGRMDLFRRRAADAGAEAPRAAGPDGLEKLLDDLKPDGVLVTSMCSTHSDYICRAMAAGFDVITEKPLTTSADKCQRIIDARKQTGRRCRVAFNYRYSPPRTQVKDILMSGAIGDVLSVDFNWMLNTHHGADYFRRWHRNKTNSGGLMVHKATHHFDLVNWWLGENPVSVFATGKREFYTPAMAKRFGLADAHERCHTCPEKDKCGFYFDLASSPKLKSLYLDNEKLDGYHRDTCVFSPQIDIEDTMNVLVTYDSNVTLCYSLNAFNSWEGYTIAFNGTQGRLEHRVVESIYVSGTETVQGGLEPGSVRTTIIPIRGPARSIEPWKGEGGHGGGDVAMLNDLFSPDAPPDKYLRAADERAGAMSCLVGIAANESIATGRRVALADLVRGLDQPDYAPMPSRDGPVPMPGKP